MDKLDHISPQAGETATSANSIASVFVVLRKHIFENGGKAVLTRSMTDLSALSLVRTTEETKDEETLPPELAVGVWDALIRQLSFWPQGTAGLAARESQFALGWLQKGTQSLQFAEAAYHKSKPFQKEIIEIKPAQTLPYDLLGILEPNAQVNGVLEQMATSKSGIALVTPPNAFGEISALSILSALQPKSIVWDLPRDAASAEKLLKLSGEQLVLLPIHSTDGTEALLSSLASFAHTPTMKQTYLKQMRGVFLHRCARRVCPFCARPTVPDAQTLIGIPKILRPKPDEQYLFGRGCPECSETSYLGLVSLSSAIDVSEQLRSALAENAPIERLLEFAYQAGTRSLFEDGLTKLLSGKTSYEALYAAVPMISDALVKVLTRLTPRSQTQEVDKQPSLPKRRILIVEDDREQRAVLETVFVTEGYDVTTAENGQLALESLSKNPVDIVLSDIMMPVMDGKELVLKMKADAQYRSIPIVMLTAAPTDTGEVDLLDLGADDYCQKTVRRKVLLKRVERLLRKTSNPLQHLMT